MCMCWSAGSSTEAPRLVQGVVRQSERAAVLCHAETPRLGVRCSTAAVSGAELYLVKHSHVFFSRKCVAVTCLVCKGSQQCS